MEGFASADEVAKSIKPKLITSTVISIIYDLPRIYLNVNLFGSLCTFYHIIIDPYTDSITYRIKTSKTNEGLRELVVSCLDSFLGGSSTGKSAINELGYYEILLLKK